MTEHRRSSPRKRTLLQGRIVFNDRFSLIECVVRDLSETGARIAFEHPIDIPPEFDLEIARKGISRRCRVSWSSGKEHGLMFLGAPRPAYAVSPPAEAPAGGAGHDARGERIKAILDEARRRIAREMGVPAHSIGLRLKVDPRQQGGSDEG
jgi:hypothetical protein